MNYYSPNTASYGEAQLNERSLFLRRVYGHLAGAVLGFVALEAVFLSSSTMKSAALQMVGSGRWMWLVILLAFMGVSVLANRMAHSMTSRSVQYAGLALYTFCEALFFLPLLALLELRDPSHSILLKAVLITSGLFLGLSTVALSTRRDLSGMGRFIKVGMWVALAVILASLIFGFTLGVFFISLMVALMAACILWETQKIAREYPAEGYVGASLVIFSSLATLFWYVIQLVGSFND